MVRSYPYRLITISFSLLSAACGGSSDDSDVNPQRFPEIIEVVDSFPADGATNVCPDTDIRLLFNGPIDSDDQILAELVTVSRNSSNDKYPCTWAPNFSSEEEGSNFELRCSVNETFPPGAEITVQVRSGLQTRSGLGVKEKTIGFRVGFNANNCLKDNFKPIYTTTGEGAIVALSYFKSEEYTPAALNEYFQYQNDNWFVQTLTQVALPAAPFMIVQFSERITSIAANSVLFMYSNSLSALGQPLNSFFSSGQGLFAQVASNVEVYVYGKAPSNYYCLNRPVPQDDPRFYNRALIICPQNIDGEWTVDKTQPRLMALWLRANMISASGKTLEVPHLIPFVFNNGLVGMPD